MKKAILVVSFGTSYLEVLEKSIQKAENQIKDHFDGYEVFRAFTAHKIIKKLKIKNNIFIDTPEEALDKLYKSGFEEVIIQPLHIIPGEEFQYIKNVQEAYINKFKSIKLGRPIFYYQGIEDLPQDYSIFINTIEEVFENKEAVVMVGHGTAHSANAVYGCLQSVLQDHGYDNVFVGTVEGYPTFDIVLNRIKKKNIKEVTLMPLMVVAGDHAINDMASDEEDSWKSMLEAEGIKVKLHMKGLGELEKFNKLYIKRIEDIIENRYVGAGETKKGKVNENNNNFIQL
ncbi:sirohydrochlorin cobaltochelatase [Clostridium chauvoei]|uniref:Putative Sirohydrochlorin cobaltochelatase n=1 Tax=Clostridium chauvoei JF4335 TaxID=1351755 RepID=S6EJU6_9CLOT|nr:sirohydrochlorin cobaltochelatase [Clostridium chauvoei]ATD54827.1 sirohydrochlorin cobaltochelatase [Clostridium chauvoei]ATD57493.1 sirohydrochlorin cobaltochelatase [Clostridium chauvoei]MBX7281169.1 sirohydrochlorin cobaltochelatase [Clostridium chauvoei]MBX7283655.1 sirohydrochlorin cobaltochelatase [Clostridium chauvoei]MBX7286263.1 sirohydrochlorin cobaltochelatase [Clostridium chauvoei]